MVNQKSPTPRLADLWLPVMMQVHALFQDASRDDANSTGARIVAAVEQAAARSREQGYAPERIEQAKFAIVAWLDETVMTRDWPGAIAWRLAPLQKKYFSTTRSGVEFFQRLEALDAADAEVREVYGLALAAGFQGHYGGANPQALAEYRRGALEDILAAAQVAPLEAGQPLFPLAQPAPQAAGGYRRRVQPVLTTLALIIAPILLLAGAYFLFDAMLASKVAALVGMS